MRVIGDYEYSGNRSLNDEEVAFLAGEIEKSRRRKLFYLLGLTAPFALVVFSAGIGLVFFRESEFAGMIWMLIVFLWLVGIAVFIVRFPAERRHQKEIEFDLASGMVEAYSLSTEEEDIPLEIARASSGRMLVPGRPDAYRAIVHPVDLAETPASSTEFPSRIVSVDEDHVIRERALSGDEIRELSQFLAARTGGSKALALIVLIAIFGLTVAIAIIHPGSFSILRPAIYGLIFFFPVLRTLKWRQRLAKASHDLQAGVVHLDKDRHGAPVEYLPTSLLRWTENGEPAKWRSHFL